MVAAGHITAAAKMNPSYLPGGANVHPYLMHCSFGPLESAVNCILIGSAVLYIATIAAAPGTIHRIRQFAPICIIIISIPSPIHSFILGLKPSFSANPSHSSLPFLLQD